MIFCITALDYPVVHATGAGDLSGVAGLGLDYGVVNHVVALHFHDQVAAVVFLYKKVWVVAAHGVGIRVDVLDEKLALAVGEHAGKENLLDPAVA